MAHTLLLGKGKSGSAAVMLTILFAGMMIIVSTLVNAGAYITGKNISETATDLACRAVLSEYDRELYQDYGIFAYNGDPSSAEKNIFNYAGASLKADGRTMEQNGIDMLRLKLLSIRVDLKGHSLADIDLFEYQLAEEMKYRFLFEDLDRFQKNNAEFERGLFFIEIANKITAVIEDFSIMKEWLSTIKTAELENNEAEKVLYGDIMEFGAIESYNLIEEARMNTLMKLCRAIRINDEIIIFNAERIGNVSKEIEDIIDDAEAFLQSNLELDRESNVSSMLEKVNSIRNVLEQLERCWSNEWKLKIEENIALLENMNEDPQYIIRNKDAFIDDYHWHIGVMPEENFNIEEIESQAFSDFSEKDQYNTNRSMPKAESIDSGRRLQNETVINSLPSNDYVKSNFPEIRIPNFEGFGAYKKLFEKGMNIFLIDRYIMTYMNCHISEFDANKNFFRNETEYILYGSHDDKENFEKFKSDFILLRTGLNIAHIIGDQFKNSQVKTLASALIPGPWSGLSELVIMAIWAEAEAVNDFRLIEAGKTVSFIKKSEDWALSFQNLLDGNQGQLWIPEGDEKGWDYENYLELFLIFENRPEKLLRTMDIIQINMRGRYNQFFDFKNHFCGLNYHLIVRRSPFMPSFNWFVKNEIELEGEHVY